jgi:hypothetical protein
MKQLNKHEIVDEIIDYFIEQELHLDDCLEISNMLYGKINTTIENQKVIHGIMNVERANREE